jgi:hypothetical protein
VVEIVALVVLTLIHHKDSKKRRRGRLTSAPGSVHRD